MNRKKCGSEDLTILLISLSRGSTVQLIERNCAAGICLSRTSHWVSVCSLMTGDSDSVDKPEGQILLPRDVMGGDVDFDVRLQPNHPLGFLPKPTLSHGSHQSP